MESEIDLLKQENARLVAKTTGLESEKVELLKQVAEEKAKHAELRTRIKELEKGRTDTVDAIAELKAEVVKLRDDNEQTFLQSEILPEVTVKSLLRHKYYLSRRSVSIRIKTVIRIK